MTHEEFRRAIHPADYRSKSGRIVIEDLDGVDIEIQTVGISEPQKRLQAYEALVRMGKIKGKT